LRTKSLKLNTISNLFGSGWSAFLSVVAVPVYLHYLGVEAYGIIGVFITIQALASLLDFGVSVIISRELARLSAHPDKAQEMHDITRVTEIVTWVMASLIGLFLLALAPVIAGYWLQSERLSVAVVTQALMIMSAGLMAQWTVNFYTNGLVGLERQFLLNVINSVCILFKTGGAILVLAFVSSTIQSLLLWQALIGFIQAAVMAVALRKCLPAATSSGRLRWDLLKEKWRFAAGVTGMGILGLILAQLDKVILSRMLSLEFFGYYTLATTIASVSLGLIARGVASAVYPRFSYLVSRDDEAELTSLYHRSTQIVAALMLPAGTLLMVFPYEIIRLWTQNDVNAENTWVLVTLLAIAAVLNGFLHVPYYLQLAYGWTRIIITVALIGICVTTPTMLITVHYYGALAGAGSWLLLNFLTLIISVYLLHKQTLRGELWRWYLVDLAAPAVVALAVAFCGRFFLEPDASLMKVLLVLAVTGIAGYAATALSLKAVRDMAWAYYKSYT
jgi:O-antigen/teichoic acid export membrane protein